MQRKATGLKRRSVLEQPTKKTTQNTLKRRGYFAGQEIVDEHRQHLEPDELKLFFRKCEQEENEGNALTRKTKGLFWSSYFTIQYYFGCRLSEPALILDTDDVSVEKKQIVIKRLKKKSLDTGYKAFVYPMDDKIATSVEYIRRWKQNRELEYNPFLFPSRRHQKVCGAERLSQLRNLDGSQAVSRFTADRFFKKIAKDECKFPDNLCSSAVLRNTRAIFMLAAEVPPEQVQWLLGHSSLKMTWRFMSSALALRAKLTPEQLVELVAGFGL